MSSTAEWQSQLEDQYILDFERALEVRQRRNQLLAMWIVSHSMRNDPAHVEKILQIGVEESTDAAYCQRILLEAGDILTDIGEQQLKDQMRALLLTAAAQLAGDYRRLEGET